MSSSNGIGDEINLLGVVLPAVAVVVIGVFVLVTTIVGLIFKQCQKKLQQGMYNNGLKMCEICFHTITLLCSGDCATMQREVNQVLPAASEIL